MSRNIAPSLPITIGRRGRKLRFTIMNGESIKQTVASYSDLIAISIPVYQCLYKVIDTNKYYRYAYGDFTEVDTSLLYQPLKIYEINGDFMIKGKR